MLTLVKLPKANNNEARVELPPETALVDRDRFVRLAAVFYGHASPDGSWIFTEMRGRKCLALWAAGFDGNGQHQKSSNKPVVRGGVAFEVSEAMRVVKSEQRAVAVTVTEDFG